MPSVARDPGRAQSEAAAGRSQTMMNRPSSSSTSKLPGARGFLSIGAERSEGWPTAATRSVWSLFLAGVHSDGSFLKAAVVGSVASQEAVQHVQAR